MIGDANINIRKDSRHQQFIIWNIIRRIKIYKVRITPNLFEHKINP